MNGVIWSKKQKTFVPISNVPIYAMMQQERFEQSRALETHNFRLQNLTLTAFPEPHFLEFYDNNTKISGICGEIWNLLSETLNFTLQPIRTNISSMGFSWNDFQDGLLGVIHRNETMVIPKTGITGTIRLKAADITMPFWMKSNRLYIRLEVMHDNTWMIKIFSWKIWCSVMIMLILLSICNFFTQRVLARFTNKCKSISFGEQLFYNFGQLCNQDYIPENLYERSRILEISTNLFFSIISMAFGAVLFIYITKQIFIPPFDSMESLIHNTNYDIVTLKDDAADIILKTDKSQLYAQVRAANRVVVAPTTQEMFKMVCSSTKRYALLQGVEDYKMRNQTLCNLIPVGPDYMKVFIVSSLIKNFKYKRTVDLGILKLTEVGLLDMLKKRWLNKNIKKYVNNTPQPIEMDQISLVIKIMYYGTVIALIIFIIEKIVFVYKFKQS